MRTFLVICLAAVAASGPVPAGNYKISAPLNSVSLHGQARQAIQGGSSGNFAVKLKTSIEAEDVALANAAGLLNAGTNRAAKTTGSFATAASLGLVGASIEQPDFESEEAFLSCPKGQLRHGRRCVLPKINRNIFVFGREDSGEGKDIDEAFIPQPELEYNIIFVKSKAQQRKPYIIPPPQKKTIVYVLESEEKVEALQAPRHPESDPSVYYVTVKDDASNIQLPGAEGLDLNTAYQQALAQQGGGAAALLADQLDDALDNNEVDFELDLESLAAQAAAGGTGAFGKDNLANTGLPLDNIANVGVPLDNTPNDKFANTGIPLPSFDGASVAGPIDNFDFGASLDAGRPLSDTNSFQDTQSLASNLGAFNSVGVPLPSSGNSGNTVDLGDIGDFGNFGSAGGLGRQLPSGSGTAGAKSQGQQPVITMEMIRQALLGAQS